MSIQPVKSAIVIDPKTTTRRSGLQNVLARRRWKPVGKIIVDPIAQGGMARRIGLAKLRVGRKFPVIERLRAGLTEQLKHQGSPGGEKWTGAARVQNKLRAVTTAQSVAQGVIRVDVVFGDPNRHRGQVGLSSQLRIDVADLVCKVGHCWKDCVVEVCWLQVE